MLGLRPSDSAVFAADAAAYLRIPHDVCHRLCLPLVALVLTMQVELYAAPKQTPEGATCPRGLCWSVSPVLIAACGENRIADEALVGRDVHRVRSPLQWSVVRC